MSAAPPPVRIEVWADLACPWCWIGEHRLLRAVRQRPGLEIELRWRPFILQPDLPLEGADWGDFIAAKFGGMDRARSAFEQVARAGAEEGLVFRFDRIRRAPHTAAAHRLILEGEGAGIGFEVADALFRAHFSEGMDLSDAETLRGVAIGAGLLPAAVDCVLDGCRWTDAVETSQVQARRLGIRGVPFFLFDGRYAISGAHPPDAILHAIDTAMRERVLLS